MTTPRIEEMLEEYISIQARYKKQEIDGKTELILTSVPLKETIDWLRKALTEAHQAGKIQALHLLEDLYAEAEDKAELIEMFNEALQDNK